ncbi:hypothetical protein DFH06DRAFT_750952 [Mycena polygramma]|nr:hypothetical protein DFH06DRAFT_750952 [Mycena polygramma]
MFGVKRTDHFGVNARTTCASSLFLSRFWLSHRDAIMISKSRGGADVKARINLPTRHDPSTFQTIENAPAPDRVYFFPGHRRQRRRALRRRHDELRSFQHDSNRATQQSALYLAPSPLRTHDIWQRSPGVPRLVLGRRSCVPHGVLRSPYGHPPRPKPCSPCRCGSAHHRRAAHYDLDASHIQGVGRREVLWNGRTDRRTLGSLDEAIPYWEFD